MLQKIILQNFRNYSQKTFEFNSQVTLFVGPNAIGKTSILEGIYYLATGKSLKAREEKEVIKETETVGRIVGLVSDLELEIIWDNRERFSKLYRVNGVGKRQLDFVGHLQAVLFQPVDLEIVIGSPSIRRHYLDSVLSQTHRDYRQAASIYEKALRQRNRILYQIKKEGLDTRHQGSEFEYWDELLIQHGTTIHNYRRGYLKFLNEQKNDFLEVEINYDHSIISKERLEKYHMEEIMSGNTLVGPHRDDFAIKYKALSAKNKTLSQNLSSYGSRGEQRLGVLALKIGELDYIEAQTGNRPVFLLDDIFSELDKENRKHVLDVIGKQQTVITTTDIHNTEEAFLKKIKGEEVRLG